MKKLLTILAMLVFILSCGSKGGSSSNTFTLNITAEPESVDPQLSTDVAGSDVLTFISEGILKRDKDGKVVGGLAEKWEVSEDGLKWTFHLRDGIKWSNGDPITAEDFKTAWVRGLDPKVASQYSYMLYPIKNGEAFNNDKVKAEDLGIKVIDDKTIEVTLEAPTPYFEDLVTFKTYLPVNTKVLSEKGDKYYTEGPENFVSSGPYVMKEWTHDSEIKLEKNPNYYDAANVKVDNVVLKLISDNAAAFNAFKNREVDVTSVTTEQAKEFAGDDRLKSNNDGSVWYMEFNMKNKVLTNKNIRKALLMAVNREEMTSKVLNGSGAPAKTFVPAGIGMKGLEKADFTEEVTSQIPGFNPEEAKKLLAEGLKELGLKEFPSLELLFNDSGNNKVIAEYIQESLNKNLGINLNLAAVEFKERVSRMKSQQFDIVLTGWSGDFKDPITYLDLFTTNGGNNHGKYSNPKYDELVKKVKSTGDQKVRYEAMREIEQIIAEEVPVGTLFHRERKYLVNPKVQGLGFMAIGGEFNISNLSIKK